MAGWYCCCGGDCPNCSSDCNEIDVDLAGFANRTCGSCASFNTGVTPLTATYVGYNSGAGGVDWCAWTHALASTICNTDYIHVILERNTLFGDPNYGKYRWNVAGSNSSDPSTYPTFSIGHWWIYGDWESTKPNCSTLLAESLSNTDYVGLTEDCDYSGATASLTSGTCV